MPPTVPLEQVMAQAREIKALKAEVERLREEINKQTDHAVAADFETLSTLVTDKNERMAQLKQKLDAEHTRYVLADAGWREMNRRYLAAEADVKALAEALEGLMQWGVEQDDERLHYVTVQVERADIVVAGDALYREGVRRGREEETG